MPYGEIRVDTITFTNAGVDKSITVSGLFASTSGNLTVTGTISGTTFTGTTASFTSGNVITFSGGTCTITSGVFASGTATNPSISFIADSNTGLYSPGADQVAISTSGTGRLFVDAGGNVGVGATPGRTFQVTNGANAIVSVKNGTIEGVLNATTSNVNIGAASNDFLTISINSAERLRVDTSGRLGVGTSSPQAQLHVLDSIKVSSSSQSQGSLMLGDGGSTSFNVGIARWNGTTNAAGAGGIGYFSQGSSNVGGHYFYTGDAVAGSQTERLRIDSSGRVGIGTSNPGCKVDILAESNTSLSPTIRVNSNNVAVNTALAYDGLICNSQLTIGNTTTNPLIFNTNSTERLRIDSSGNVGIGTTSPQAYSGFTVLTVDNATNGGVVSVRKNGTALLNLYTATGFGVIEGVGTGTGLTFVANNAERLRIDSSGRLLVGTSTVSGSVGAAPYAKIQVEGNTFGANGPGSIAIRTDKATTSIVAGNEIGQIAFAASGSNGEFARIDCIADANAGSSDYPGRLVFSTTADGASSPTERMRITSGGYIKASNTGSYTDSGGGSRATNAQHFFSSDQNGLTIQATNTNINTAVEGFTSDFATGATGNHFIGAINLVRVFIVAANGNVTNTNNSYGAISDVKLKANIVDANSQWDDLKALQVRNYNLKEGQTHTQIGLIAQEAELVSPGLVSESPDLDAEGNELGTVTKSVNYSVLYMKAVKALQEAMARIETLEAKVAALEGA